MPEPRVSRNKVERTIRIYASAEDPLNDLDPSLIDVIDWAFDLRDARDRITELETNHCKDCCCARLWAALGISGYTGMSLVEHIELLARDRRGLEAEIARLRAGYTSGTRFEGKEPG